MVVRDEDQMEHQQQLKDIQFEEILSVEDEVGLDDQYNSFLKSSIDSDLGLLGMNCGLTWKNTDKFFCVDMETKDLIFQHSSHGRYTHHWITINDQKYLSLQTTPNTISMFRVSDDHQFEEDDSMKITLGDDDVINFCEYDQSADHLFIVKNSSILEKRAVNDSGIVSMSIALENRIGNSISKLMSLSNDGKFCVIGAAGNTYSGAAACDFFYIISLETQEQFKLTTTKLTNTFSPCFINGDSRFVAVGGNYGEGVEIWSVEDKEMVHHFNDTVEDNSYVSCSFSANGILAVGYNAKTIKKKDLRLYDVSSLQKIYEHEFTMTLRSLFLTADCRYLATSGSRLVTASKREICIVLQIC